MKVLQAYKSEPDNWFETSLEEVEILCEESGHWKEGTVRKMLREGMTVFTPFSLFKKKEIKEKNIYKW